MKVAELIDVLKGLDGDDEVVVNVNFSHFNTDIIEVISIHKDENQRCVVLEVE